MSIPRPRVLVIEDDPPIRRFLRISLEQQGLEPIEAATGREGLNAAASLPPDLVLLDLGLPDLDGLDVLAALREWTSIPIIVLSARGQEQDKVAALDAGADDYLTKPFGVPELAARIRVALRHHARAAAGAGAEDPVLSIQHLTLDLNHRRVSVDGEPVHLTPIEYKLLSTLAKHAGKVVTHRQLLQEVWGPQRGAEIHYLRVYMGHLRGKIERDPAQPRVLLTEPGVGYRLALE
jgi:two-component system KDP operon response regulator KdpE